jgi:hypothetical protein
MVGRLCCLGIALLLTAVCLTGCGSAKPLSRAQLVDRTDALCTRVQKKMKTVGPADGAQGLARVARKLASFEQQELESMRMLTPPTSLASDWKALIEGVEEISESAATLSTDVRFKQNKHAIEALKQIGQVERRVSVIVKRDGFKNCEGLG